MSIYAISDIHGNNHMFQTLLRTISFKKTDTLFLLGDYIDRGETSKGVLDTIFLLLENGFDVHCCRGNHEQMFLDSLHSTKILVSWIKNGGDMTMNSFLTSEVDRIPEKYIAFIEALPNYMEYENFLMVHAGIDMKKDDPLGDTHSLLWLRGWEESYDQEWLAGRTVIHGHTPMKSSFLESPQNYNSDIVCIDNGSYMKGVKEFGGLCAFNLDSREMTIIK